MPAPITNPQAREVENALFHAINAGPRPEQWPLFEALKQATRDDVKCAFEMVGHKMKETVQGKDVP